VDFLTTDRQQVVRDREICRFSQFYHRRLDKRRPYQVYGAADKQLPEVGDYAYPGRHITASDGKTCLGGGGLWMFEDKVRARRP